MDLRCPVCRIAVTAGVDCNASVEAGCGDSRCTRIEAGMGVDGCRRRALRGNRVGGVKDLGEGAGAGRRQGNYRSVRPPVCLEFPLHGAGRALRADLHRPDQRFRRESIRHRPCGQAGRGRRGDRDAKGARGSRRAADIEIAGCDPRFFCAGVTHQTGCGAGDGNSAGDPCGPGGRV